MLVFLIALASYLIGSLSFARIVSRAFGLPDPRTYGSHNPGATNVLRTGNKAAAALTLLGDAAKGWIAVALARWLAQRWGLGEMAVALAALAVFLGHAFPVFHRFAGGKGVATALGVLLALRWELGLGVGLIWLAVFALTRISSLAALTAALAAPLLAYYFLRASALTLVVCVLAAVLVYRHKSNIQNLLKGSEGRFGKAP